jgi:hypothetical protein
VVGGRLAWSAPAQIRDRSVVCVNSSASGRALPKIPKASFPFLEAARFFRSVTATLRWPSASRRVFRLAKCFAPLLAPTWPLPVHGGRHPLILSRGHGPLCPAWLRARCDISATCIRTRLSSAGIPLSTCRRRLRPLHHVRHTRTYLRRTSRMPHRLFRAHVPVQRSLHERRER